MATSYGSSPLLGQASGGWTESSSALRILNVGIRNTLGVATEDAFTQTNPPVVSTAGTVSKQLPTAPKAGVLSGSVAFARGGGTVGGPAAASTDASGVVAPLGVFVNSAVGNPFENTPAAASGRLTYVSGFGSYANGLYETQALVTAAPVTAGDDLAYGAGMSLFASKNGYLTCEAAAGSHASSVVMGVLIVPPDAANDELVYDQRV